jgi:hypothetical protein
MTPQEFDAALSKTRLKDRAATAARLVLVDGLGYTQAGNNVEPRLQRQNVLDAVSRIEREHRRNIGAPNGWKCLTLVLPWLGPEWEEAEQLQSRAYERMKNAVNRSAS